MPESQIMGATPPMVAARLVVITYRTNAGLPEKVLQRCSKCGAEKQRRAEYALCGNCADRQRQDKRKVDRIRVRELPITNDD